MGVDLKTTYLGLPLRNPVVVAACPLTGSIESLQQLERSGAAAAVLPSLFAEQIEHDEQQVAGLYEQPSESFAETTSYFPQMSDWHTGPEPYLKHIRLCKETLSIPIIASLNGSNAGTWTRYAKMIEDAGADALELNIYFVPTDSVETSEVIEARYARLVAAVRQAITIGLRSRLARISAVCHTWPVDSVTAELRGWCCSIGTSIPTSTRRLCRFLPVWC